MHAVDRAIGSRFADSEPHFLFRGIRDPAKAFATQMNMLKVAEKAKERVPRASSTSPDALMQVRFGVVSVPQSPKT